ILSAVLGCVVSVTEFYFRTQYILHESPSSLSFNEYWHVGSAKAWVIVTAILLFFRRSLFYHDLKKLCILGTLMVTVFILQLILSLCCLPKTAAGK
ncbi:MAG TPA: hypothetical protein VHV83_05105, partial [Armatimonadota bacterium]|nr:hypothetical protein [Armatimonadota bacterium]